MTTPQVIPRCLLGLVFGVLLLPGPRPAGATESGCTYPPPDDPDALVQSVAALAKQLGAPDAPEVGIRFEKSVAEVTVRAGQREVRIRWSAGSDCRPPFERLSDPPDGPGWAVQLHQQLPERFAHKPIFAGGSPRTERPSAWLLVALPWLLWLTAVLLWLPGTPSPPVERSPSDRIWLGLIPIAGVGLVILTMRWTSGLTTADEHGYLWIRRGPADLWSLSYYLNDDGLPSRVHRALLIPLVALGGRTGLSAWHGVLYLVWLVAIYRIARRLGGPGWSALLVVAACAFHPRILLYFGELRSYASFLTTAALGTAFALAYLDDGRRRDGLMATATLGLAALDNPLCIALVAAFAGVVLLRRSHRQERHLARVVSAAALLAGAAAPAALLASTVTRHATAASAFQWWSAAAFYILPAAAVLVTRRTSRLLRDAAAMVLVVLAIVLLPMAIGIFPMDAGKLELFALPLVFAVAVGGARRAVAPPVLTLLAVLYLGGYGAIMKFPAEAEELNVAALAESARSVDDALHHEAETRGRVTVYFGRSFKRIEFASYLTRVDPFVLGPNENPGLSGHYHFVDGGWPREACGAGTPFWIVVSPWGPAPACKPCALSINDQTGWHAWRCN